MAELTEETVQNLNKVLEKTNAMLLTAGNKVSDIKDDIKDTTKNIEKSGKSTTKMMDGLYNTLDKMCETTDSIVGMVSGGAFMASFATMAKNAWKLNNDMTSIAVQMGKGRAHSKELEKSVSGIMKDFGANFENARELVTTLAQSKYSDNIRDAAAGADLFARATGVSSDQVAQLIVMLNKQGDMSAKASNSLLAGMTKVQQKVGISKSGMEALTQQISDMTFNMAAFGKSSEEISRAAVKTTAFVGALEQVGVSAQRATQLLNDLTDPDRIEDNILLYSQLGLSIEDAMNGGVEEALNSDAFKEMADKITAMGPVAGSQFAKSMGLSYKEVTRMAKMEAGGMESLIEEAMTPEEKSLDALQKMTAEAEGLGKKIGNFFNKIEGFLLRAGPLVLTGLTVIAPKILKLIKETFQKAGQGKDGIQASVATEVAEGIKMGGGPLFRARVLSSKFAESGAEALKNKRMMGEANTQEKLGSIRKEREDIAGKLGELKGDDSKISIQMQAKLRSRLNKLDKEEQSLKEKYIRQLEKRGVDTEKLDKANNNLNKALKAQAKQQEAFNKREARINALKQKALGATGKELEELNKTINEEEARHKEMSKQLIKANNSVENYQKEIKDISEGNKASKGNSILGNLVSGVKDRAKASAGNIGKAALSGLSGVLKHIGPMAIGMTIISKILQSMQQPLENLMNNVFKNLKPFMDVVTGVLCKVLNSLVKNLLPPMLTVLGYLLKVLNFILKPIEGILKGLSKLPGMGFLADVAEGLNEITGSSNALIDAAKNIKNSNEDLTAATEENTEAAEAAPTITAVGGKAVMTNGGNSPTANGSIGSITQSTKEQKSDEERNKEAQRDSLEKDKAAQAESQTAKLNDLVAQFNKAIDYLKQIAAGVSNNQFNGANFSTSGLSGESF